MTENEIRAAAAANTELTDFDGTTGVPTGRIYDDGETIVAEIIGRRVRRYADILDLAPRV